MTADPAGRGFVLLFEPPTNPETEAAYGRIADDVSDACERVLGLPCAVRWACLPAPGRDQGGSHGLAAQEAALSTLSTLSKAGHDPLFLLPCSFEFDLQDKAWLTDLVRTAQRRLPTCTIHYDRFDGHHPLLLQAVLESATLALRELNTVRPQSTGLLLIARGTGGAETRADAFKTMRLLWEQLGVQRADVAFLRHAQTPLPEQLEHCARSGLAWVAVTQELWHSESFQYAKVLVADAAGQLNFPVVLSTPVGGHDNVRALLTQRCLELHRSHRVRVEHRERSPKYQTLPSLVHGPKGSAQLSELKELPSTLGYGSAVVGELGANEDLGRLLALIGVQPRRSVVKPTWHGYATGTYTDPLALDAVLGALGKRCVLVEAHTCSRNDGSANFNWETEAQENRVWISEQEQQYLQKTGLNAVMQRHGASYINTTEAHWTGNCASRDAVAAVLDAQGVELRFQELLEYVPQALFDLRGSPMLSFARFKGPTRLSISNLFGLLPPPLRAAWHGPNITYFAQVCCDLARLYGSLFQLYGVVESLACAVRWDQRGVYRSRWGNYDVIPRPGIVVASRGVASADVLAARLQGQDVRRSAFFDVVETELGFDSELATVTLPASLVGRFV